MVAMNKPHNCGNDCESPEFKIIKCEQLLEQWNKCAL